MKVSVREIHSSMDALTALSGTKVPAVTAFRLARLMKALKDPLEAFDIARVKLLKEVGTPTKDNPDKFDIVDIEQWKQHLDALLAQEVEVPFEKLKPTDLGEAEIEPRTLLLLDWCFE